MNEKEFDAVEALGKLRGCVQEQITLLELGLHALRAERYHVTDEYVERVIDALVEKMNKTRIAS